MYAFELSANSPCRSAPYYSLVIRKPYILGHGAAADFNLAYEGISAEHVSMTVLHEKEAAHEVTVVTLVAAAAHDDEKDAAACVQGEQENGAAATTDEADAGSGSLVVRVTALPTKGDAEVRLGDTTLDAGDSAIARNGDILYLGDGVCATFRYRPLMVGIEAGAYAEDYLSDLRRMFGQLGATVVDEPTPSHEAAATPIGQLYCAAELSDSPGCLAALSCGYSVVQPTYVFEWFAAVAKCAAAPLSTLPAPSRFEVPVRCTTHPPSAAYLRPESDSCPFSLFPIPLTAMTKRSRADLFANRAFFFFTDAAATRYGRVVEQCGGAVYGPGDVESAKEVIRMLVESQREAGMPCDRLPTNFYIIIDNASEATLLSSGLEAASPELLAFIEEACATLGATRLPVMGDHTLFTALLSNKFYEEPVQLVTDVSPAGSVGCNPPQYSPADGVMVPSLTPHADMSEEGAAITSSRAPRSVYAGNGEAPIRARSTSRVSERRASLLPRSTARTPSRSQMRSYSRQRARSFSRATGHSSEVPLSAEGTAPSGYGRRRLVPSLVESDLGNFVAKFDALRLRIYTYLVREEPKLDRAITIYRKKFFVDSDTMEYALEVKAQAVDFMEHADDLLADAASRGAYAEALRRFWRDCRDMDVKAQHLLHCWDRSMPGAALPRCIQSRRASSTESRRAASLRSMNAHGAEQPAKSLAPAARGAEAVTTDAENDAEAFSNTQRPLGRDGVRGSGGLFTSPETFTGEESTGRLQESPITLHDGAAAMRRSGTVAAASVTAPDAVFTSARRSQRRSYTPLWSQPRSGAAVGAPRSVPMEARPPWVSNWNSADPAEGPRQPKPQKRRPKSKKKRQAKSCKPGLQTSGLASAPLPARRTRPAVQAPEFASDSPSVVRARSAARVGSTYARYPPPAQLEPALHADGEHFSEGPASFGEPEREAKAAIGIYGANADTVNTEDTEQEDESQLRTEPPPVPEAAPTTTTRAATQCRTLPLNLELPSESASASKRTTLASASRRPNGKGMAAPTAGNGNGYHQRDASDVAAANGNGYTKPHSV
ncbi:hypothetical protein LSCM1_05520 [Leishmania martiniquensis]|uniref:Uncharacterized protein n=1 Tax=Leishmania martiniquensis TaxID=1580590 RepID=A0A836H8H7_9TRYP|nr:hypothetical protein LSCM1_05520 [Leishmania martiniquensis]